MTKDYVGKKYGKLTVTKELESVIQPSGRLRRVFLCLCECGNTIVVSQCNLISGNTISCGCAKSLPLEEYIKEGKKYGLEYVGGYDRNTHTSITWKCKKGHIFSCSIKSLHRCSYCSGTKVSPEEIQDRIIHRNIIWLGPYSERRRKTRWKCTVCGHIWEAPPNNVIWHGSGCPECNRTRMKNMPRCSACGHIIKVEVPCIYCARRKRLAK